MLLVKAAITDADDVTVGPGGLWLSECLLHVRDFYLQSSLQPLRCPILIPTQVRTQNSKTPRALPRVMGNGTLPVFSLHPRSLTTLPQSSQQGVGKA